MKVISVDAETLRILEESLGVNFEQAAQEAQERRAAAARAVAEEKRLRAEEREQRRQELRWQTFADELGERVRVEINGEAIPTVKKAVCPHCGRVSADLLRLAINAGDLLLLSERQGGPFQPINCPSTDRRWRVAPHIEAPIACECGGDFSLSIVVLP